MTTDFPTASAGTSQAPSAAVEKSHSASHTEIRTLPPRPPGVYSPDKVETRLGTLNFVDGFPDKASAEKLFDNLDFQRAVQAYLLAIPAVS